MRLPPIYTFDDGTTQTYDYRAVTDFTVKSQNWSLSFANQGTKPDFDAGNNFKGSEDYLSTGFVQEDLATTFSGYLAISASFNFESLTDVWPTSAIPPRAQIAGLPLRTFAVVFAPSNGGPAFVGFGGTLDYVGDTPQELAGVPEPASWAMMIAGFGLAGAAARRRSKIAPAAA